MTDLLIREDTGEMAVVRVVDGHQPPSERPTIIDAFDVIERHGHDQITAWAEGQAAQIKAELRALCDEEFQQHRHVRKQIKERVQSWITLPAGFLDVPFVWAELPEREWKPGDPLPLPPLPDPVQAYFDADTSEDLPGRTVPGDGIPILAAAYHGNREGWTPTVPALAPAPEGTYTQHGAVDTSGRRSWSDEWAGFRADVADMFRDAWAALTWWRKEEN